MRNTMPLQTGLGLTRAATSLAGIQLSGASSAYCEALAHHVDSSASFMTTSSGASGYPRPASRRNEAVLAVGFTEVNHNEHRGTSLRADCTAPGSRCGR